MLPHQFALHDNFFEKLIFVLYREFFCLYQGMNLIQFELCNCNNKISSQQQISV